MILSLISRLRTHDSLARRLTEGVVAGAAVRVLGMGFTFLVGIQLARYLGPESYGLYGMIMAAVALLAVFAQLGLPQLVTREVSTAVVTADLQALKAILVWFGLLVLATSSILLLISASILMVLPSIEASVRSAAVWGLAAVPLIAILNLSIGAHRGFHLVVRAQVFDALIRPALFALLLFAAASVMPVGASTAIALQLLATATALVLCIRELVRAVPIGTFGLRLTQFRRSIFRGAAPMLVTELLRVVDGQYAILLFGVLAVLSDVGVFRVALAPVAFVGLPSTLINLVVMSFVVKLRVEGDQRRLQLLAASSALAIFISTTLLTILLYIFGKPLIAILFGQEYESAWLPLILMSFAYTVSGFFGSATTILNMSGQERTVTSVHLFSPVAGCALTLALFHNFGVASAAIAMIIVELLKGVWMAYAAKSQLGLSVTVFSVANLAVKNQCR